MPFRTFALGGHVAVDSVCMDTLPGITRHAECCKLLSLLLAWLQSVLLCDGITSGAAAEEERASRLLLSLAEGGDKKT
jgi:hypothetical protein